MAGVLLQDSLNKLLVPGTSSIVALRIAPSPCPTWYMLHVQVAEDFAPATGVRRRLPFPHTAGGQLFVVLMMTARSPAGSLRCLTSRCSAVLTASCTARCRPLQPARCYRVGGNTVSSLVSQPSVAQLAECQWLSGCRAMALHTHVHLRAPSWEQADTAACCRRCRGTADSIARPPPKASCPAAAACPGHGLVRPTQAAPSWSRKPRVTMPAAVADVAVLPHGQGWVALRRRCARTDAELQP